MRARQRHFKYKSIGPRAAYDARYISGLSDGAAVSSWSDLSGNSFTATQGATSRQPVYKIATLGGSPSVRFDGAGDNLGHNITHNTGCSIITALNYLSSQAIYRGLFSVTTTAQLGDTVLLLRMTSNKWGTYVAADKPATTALTIGAPAILSMTDDRASGGSFNFNGNANGTWTGNSISQGQNHIGGYYTSSPLIDQTSNIDLGAFVMTATPLSAPLRRRVESSFGYSFKIACS
jgi:hypothetical protein